MTAMRRICAILATAALFAPVLAPAQGVIIENPLTPDGTISEQPLGDPSPVIESPFGLGDEPGATIDLGPIDEKPAIRPAETAPDGVVLRALDKISGELVDFDLAPRQTKQLGHIQVSLGECRYPVGNPAGDAAAYLVIRNAAAGDVVFRGWMLASSPALNALDHPRYDVWVLHCITDAGAGNG